MPTRTWDVQVAVSPRGRTLVVRRPREGLLGGMWEFPAVEVVGGADPGARPMRVAEPAVSVARGGGRAPAARSMQVAEPAAGAAVELPAVTHRFSHFTAVYRPRRVEVTAEWGEAAGRWVTPSELADLALPVAQQRIARAAGF